MPSFEILLQIYLLNNTPKRGQHFQEDAYSDDSNYDLDVSSSVNIILMLTTYICADIYTLLETFKGSHLFIRSENA